MATVVIEQATVLAVKRRDFSAAALQVVKDDVTTAALTEECTSEWNSPPHP